MKRRRHTPEQIMGKLREADRMAAEGTDTAEIGRALEAFLNTRHRWRNQYGGLKATDAKRLKELERENRELEGIVAEQALDIRGLKEVARGTGDRGRSPRGGGRRLTCRGGCAEDTLRFSPATKEAEMALVRRDPASDVDSLQSDFNRFFEGFFGRPVAGARRWSPAMDLSETPDALVLRADLPGLDPDDVSIEIKDNVLTVSGERRSEQEEKQEGYHRIERSYGSFSRSLTLPRGVDAEAVEAEFDKGVLEVRIPKPSESKPHKVAIGGGAIEGEASEKEKGSKDVYGS